MVALEAFADGLCVPAQPPKSPLPALGLQTGVQLFPARHARNRNHEVAPSVAHQALDLALIVALGWPTELIGEQIVALQLGERPRLLPLLTAEYPGHSYLRVVVEDPRGHAAEVCESLHVAFKKCLCRLGRKRR